VMGSSQAAAVPLGMGNRELVLGASRVVQDMVASASMTATCL
jgi:hypothetical protein